MQAVWSLSAHKSLKIDVGKYGTMATFPFISACSHAENSTSLTPDS